MTPQQLNRTNATNRELHRLMLSTRGREAAVEGPLVCVCVRAHVLDLSKHLGRMKRQPCLQRGQHPLVVEGQATRGGGDGDDRGPRGVKEKKYSHRRSDPPHDDGVSKRCRSTGTTLVRGLLRDAVFTPPPLFPWHLVQFFPLLHVFLWRITELFLSSPSKGDSYPASV